MCRIHSLPALLLVLGVLGVLGMTACKSETSIDDYPCPQGGTKLTYDSFGRNFLSANCQTCHGQSEDERNGAPPNYDFGTLDGVRAHKDRIFARAADDNTSMPPGPDDPSKDDRVKLAEWLACGAP